MRFTSLCFALVWCLLLLTGVTVGQRRWQRQQSGGVRFPTDDDEGKRGGGTGRALEPHRGKFPGGFYGGKKW